MRIDFRKYDISRIGMIGILCAFLLALWGLIAYSAYEESQRVKNEVVIHAGQVTYGTHSAAPMPVASMQTRTSSVPVISGGTVRDYAHYGHTSYTIHNTPYTILTTSSATVKNVGGGGNGGGMGMSMGTSSTSSRGINYGGASVSIPMLAVNSAISSAPVSAAGASAPRAISGPRYAKPSTAGDDGEWRYGGDGTNDWWYYNETDWIQVKVGDTRYDPSLDCVVVWNGSAWVPQDEYDPGVPVGNAPWLLLLLLAAAYAASQSKKKVLA